MPLLFVKDKARHRPSKFSSLPPKPQLKCWSLLGHQSISPALVVSLLPPDPELWPTLSPSQHAAPWRIHWTLGKHPLLERTRVGKWSEKRLVYSPPKWKPPLYPKPEPSQASESKQPLFWDIVHPSVAMTPSFLLYKNSFGQKSPLTNSRLVLYLSPGFLSQVYKTGTFREAWLLLPVSPPHPPYLPL